jgi:hypothetical protein
MSFKCSSNTMKGESCRYMGRYLCECCNKYYCKTHKDIHDKNKANPHVDESLLEDTSHDEAPLGDADQDGILQLFGECLGKYSLEEISQRINVCVGTVRRWRDLKSVPSQYLFDLRKILSREIDYTMYTSSQKDQFSPRVIL